MSEQLTLPLNDNEDIPSAIDPQPEAISELPKGWKKSPLQFIGLPKTPNIDPSDFPDEVFELYSVPSYSDGTPEYLPGREIGSTKQFVRPGDVLLCKIVPHLVRVWCVPESGEHRQIASGEWIVVRPSKEDATKEFMRYALIEPNFRDQFMATVSGVGGSLMRARPKAVAQIHIPLPPLEEQRRIVARLDTLMEHSRRARAELQRIPALAERQKQAVLAAAFRGELTEDWRGLYSDLPAIGLEQLQESSSKRRKVIDNTNSFSPPYSIPSSWKWHPLPALGTLDRGRSRHRPRNAAILFGGQYPFIQTGDIKAAQGRLTSFSQTYSETGLLQSRLWPQGTLCITIAANIAETAILGIDACFPDSIVGFIANDIACNAAFIEFFIRTVKADLAAFAPATAQKNINLETLNALHVPTPPLPEQQEIVRRIEAAFARIERSAAEAGRALALLERLDQATLAKAFRGEL